MERVLPIPPVSVGNELGFDHQLQRPVRAVPESHEIPYPPFPPLGPPLLPIWLRLGIPVLHV